MKELSIEEKAKAYDEIKHRINKAYNENRCTIGFILEVFPNITEKYQGKSALEAAKEEKVDNSNKVEPRFHEGDFIRHNKANIIYKVISVNGSFYYIENIKTSVRIGLFNVEQNFHLWTIADAKDGDVLAGFYGTFIFMGESDGYCGVLRDNTFIRSTGNNEWTEDLHPATKEQRDTLFARMKEEGYEWNAEKKELRKINQKSYGQRKECLDCQFNYVGECKGSCAMKRNEQKTFLQKCFNAEYERGKKDAVVWSEEDEEKFRDVIRLVEQGAPVQSIRDHYTSWLKSLKQRYTWKPTEEQMQALNEVVGIVGLFTPRGSCLKSLSEQLKRL